MYLLANVCVSFNKNIKQYLKTFKTKRYDVFVFIFLILQFASCCSCPYLKLNFKLQCLHQLHHKAPGEYLNMFAHIL